MDLFCIFWGRRMFDEHGDGDSGHDIENIRSFLFGRFSVAPSDGAAQIENIDLVKLPLQALSEAVLGIAFQPLAVGDKTDDAAILRVEAV